MTQQELELPKGWAECKIDNISDVSVEWVYGAKEWWWQCDRELDWVIIASPNEFHYEQAKYYLQQGINVFCEKPGTLSSDLLIELIELSKINGVCFYIDDVLMFEDIEPIKVKNLSSFIC